MKKARILRIRAFFMVGRGGRALSLAAAFALRAPAAFGARALCVLEGRKRHQAVTAPVA